MRGGGEQWNCPYWTWHQPRNVISLSSLPPCLIMIHMRFVGLCLPRTRIPTQWLITLTINAPVGLRRRSRCPFAFHVGRAALWRPVNLQSLPNCPLLDLCSFTMTIDSLIESFTPPPIMDSFLNGEPHNSCFLAWRITWRFPLEGELQRNMS
jgi:hypothetical protein